MHLCQTESSAAGWTQLEIFTWAFVHPSSSTQAPPWFSPKYFSSELPLHFICTISTAHLNLYLFLRTLAFNSCKICLLHSPAHPHQPSPWELVYPTSQTFFLQCLECTVLYGPMTITHAGALLGISPQHMNLLAHPPTDVTLAYKEPSLTAFPFYSLLVFITTHNYKYTFIWFFLIFMNFTQLFAFYSIPRGQQLCL